MKNAVTVYVEGNVGAGKSTLLTFIKEHFDIQIVYEPHELWQDVDGHNLLEQFFKDQARWAFTLQTYVTMTRVEQLLQAEDVNNEQVQLIERSVYSGRYCFASNAYDMHLLTDLEWVLYQKYWDQQYERLYNKPDGFIYLRIPAALCYERIAQRNRFEEKPILLEYLINLEKKHDEWLLHRQLDDGLASVPVLLLDSIEDLRSNQGMQQEYMSKIETFINSIQK